MQVTLSYTDNLKSAIRIGQSIVKEYQNESLSAAHMLKALMHKSAGLHSFIKSIGKDIGYIEEWADVRIEDCQSK